MEVGAGSSGGDLPQHAGRLRLGKIDHRDHVAHKPRGHEQTIAEEPQPDHRGSRSEEQIRHRGERRVVGLRREHTEVDLRGLLEPPGITRGADHPEAAVAQHRQGEVVVQGTRHLTGADIAGLPAGEGEPVQGGRPVTELEVVVGAESGVDPHLGADDDIGGGRGDPIGGSEQAESPGREVAAHVEGDHGGHLDPGEGVGHDHPVAAHQRLAVGSLTVVPDRDPVLHPRPRHRGAVGLQGGGDRVGHPRIHERQVGHRRGGDDADLVAHPSRGDQGTFDPHPLEHRGRSRIRQVDPGDREVLQGGSRGRRVVLHRGHGDRLGAEHHRGATVEQQGARPAPNVFGDGGQLQGSHDRGNRRVDHPQDASGDLDHEVLDGLHRVGFVDPVHDHIGAESRSSIGHRLLGRRHRVAPSRCRCAGTRGGAVGHFGGNRVAVVEARCAEAAAADVLGADAAQAVDQRVAALEAAHRGHQLHLGRVDRLAGQRREQAGDGILRGGQLHTARALAVGDNRAHQGERHHHRGCAERPRHPPRPADLAAQHAHDHLAAIAPPGGVAQSAARCRELLVELVGTAELVGTDDPVVTTILRTGPLRSIVHDTISWTSRLRRSDSLARCSSAFTAASVSSISSATVARDRSAP